MISCCNPLSDAPTRFLEIADCQIDQLGRGIIGREAPTQNFQIGEFRLPKLVDGCSFVGELAGGFDHDKGWAGDQIMRLQHPLLNSLTVSLHSFRIFLRNTLAVDSSELKCGV